MPYITRYKKKYYLLSSQININDQIPKKENSPLYYYLLLYLFKLNKCFSLGGNIDLCKRYKLYFIMLNTMLFHLFLRLLLEKLE